MQIKTFNSYHPEHIKLYEDILSLTMSVNDTYSGYPAKAREQPLFRPVKF